MDIRNLKEAREFALNYGVKAIIFGPAGSGKTPVINTAPRPILLACEPGLLSMRNSKVPTWIGSTSDLIDEFFDWFLASNESRNFDTLCIDSASEMCETFLSDLLSGRSKSGAKVHGKAAYGDMARKFLKHLDRVYHMPQKHTYIIAKQQILDMNGIMYKRPYYPGQELPTKMPHKFDQILHLDIQNVPGQGQVKAFRCQSSIDCVARDRTGNLSEFEPPHFGNLVIKAMQQ